MTNGAIGVVVLFAIAFIWSVMENAHRVKRQRKYEKRMAECDTKP
jgi:hypothetical protein